MADDAREGSGVGGSLPQVEYSGSCPLVFPRGLDARDDPERRKISSRSSIIDRANKDRPIMGIVDAQGQQIGPTSGISAGERENELNELIRARGSIVVNGIRAVYVTRIACGRARD